MPQGSHNHRYAAAMMRQDPVSPSRSTKIPKRPTPLSPRLRMHSLVPESLLRKPALSCLSAEASWPSFRLPRALRAQGLGAGNQRDLGASSFRASPKSCQRAPLQSNHRGLRESCPFVPAPTMRGKDTRTKDTDPFAKTLIGEDGSPFFSLHWDPSNSSCRALKRIDLSAWQSGPGRRLGTCPTGIGRQVQSQTAAALEKL